MSSGTDCGMLQDLNTYETSFAIRAEPADFPSLPMAELHLSPSIDIPLVA